MTANDRFVQLAIQTIPDLRDGPVSDEAQQKLEQHHGHGIYLDCHTPADMPLDGLFSREVLLRYLLRALEKDDRLNLSRILTLTDAYLDSGDGIAMRIAEYLLRSWSFPLRDPEMAAQPSGKSRSFLQDFDRKWQPWWPVVHVLDEVIMELFTAARDAHPSIEFESSRNVGMRRGLFHQYLAFYWDRAYQEGEDVFFRFSVGPNSIVGATGKRARDGPDRDFAEFELYDWSGDPSATLGPLFLPSERFGNTYMDAVIGLARQAADLTRNRLGALVEALGDPLVDRQRRLDE